MHKKTGSCRMLKSSPDHGCIYMRDVKTMTIKDIARECGVSIATVSNVLNGRKRRRPISLRAL